MQPVAFGPEFAVQPPVQEVDVDGVDVALERLRPVALANVFERLSPVPGVGLHVDFEVGEPRRIELAGSHVDPDDAVALLSPVGLDPHLVLEAALLALARHVDASARAVVLPAVVGAAHAALFIPREDH